MKKIAIIFILMTLVSCSKSRFKDADALTAKLSPGQKVGQLLLLAVPGQKINRQNKDLIERYMPGGILYFGYNIKNSKQLNKLTEDLQSYSIKNSGIPLFVSTDQEGGRVVRIRDGVTAFPGNLASGIAADADDVFDMARITGLELKNIGVNMNLAPALDVNNNPENPVINTRSFGSDPQVVAEMGESYILGLREGQCISVAKHFPGHGDTGTDSHYTLPVIKHGIERLKKVELVPFSRAISSDVDCIMSAHIYFAALIPGGESATISPFFLTHLLREEMKFPGIVMTDDMEMNAISLKMDLGTAALRSFLAGTDIILVSSYGKNIPLIYRTLLKAVNDGVISRERLERAVRRIIEMKLRYGIMNYEAETGKVSRVPFTLSEDQRKIISRGDELNKRISRNALYYSGKGELYKRNNTHSLLYISSNTAFRESLKLSDKDSLLSGSGDLFSAVKNKSKKGPVRVIYQAYSINRKYMESLSKKLRESGAELLIVYTGNPFLLAGWETEIPVLFTFSHTEESLRQAAMCLNGELEPAKKINCDTGFRQ